MNYQPTDSGCNSLNLPTDGSMTPIVVSFLGIPKNTVFLNTVEIDFLIRHSCAVLKKIHSERVIT